MWRNGQATGEERGKGEGCGVGRRARGGGGGGGGEDGGRLCEAEGMKDRPRSAFRAVQTAKHPVVALPQVPHDTASTAASSVHTGDQYLVSLMLTPVYPVAVLQKMRKWRKEVSLSVTI